MYDRNERIRAALKADVHMSGDYVNSLRDQVVSDVVNKRRGLSLESAAKSSKSLGVSALALYTATQAGAIKAKKDSGELSPGGILRACAPVVDQLAKADLDVSDLDGDPDLSEAVKELHELLNQASGDSGDASGSGGGETATKSRKSNSGPQLRPRDPFGNAIDEPGVGAYRGPFGEVIAEKGTDLAAALANDTSDEEDEAEGYDQGDDWLVNQVRRGRGGMGNSNL